MKKTSKIKPDLNRPQAAGHSGPKKATVRQRHLDEHKAPQASGVTDLHGGKGSEGGHLRRVPSIIVENDESKAKVLQPGEPGANGRLGTGTEDGDSGYGASTPSGSRLESMNTQGSLLSPTEDREGEQRVGGKRIIRREVIELTFL